jgi:tungstate transport system ATP-binding protein
VAETLLTLRDVLVYYGDSIALRIPVLDLLPGEVLAIIGPNGAGKSTLLRVMGLLQRPSSGKVLFHGANTLEGNALQARRRIATVFQEPLLLTATVHENTALGLTLRGTATREIQQRVGPWLERLGIAHLSARTASTLSGGEAQRTSLARALVLEPEILLLDEPFAALDPTTREPLLQDFQRIVNDRNITTVFITHDRNEAFALGDRVGVLEKGRLLQIGPREDVFFHPASKAAAEIVGVENRLPGVVEDCDGDSDIILVGRHRLQVRGRFKLGSKVIVCLRPEEVLVSRAIGDTETLNRLCGRVSSVFTGMTHQRVTLDCGGMKVVALMTRRDFPGLEFTEGDAVSAKFNPATAHVIEDI